jgi:hypothetical protein
MVHDIELDIQEIDQQLDPLKKYTGLEAEQFKDEIYELEKKK